MAEIIKAPENVRASKKAAAVFEGIQRRNNQIQKDLDDKLQRQEMWGIVKDFGKVLYEDTMDQRLRNKSLKFFNDQATLTATADANRILAQANEQIRLHEEAKQSKLGEKGYWRNYYISNVYAPKIQNMLAQEGVVNPNTADILTLSKMHVDKDFNVLFNNTQNLYNEAVKVRTAGGENLKNYKAALNTALGNESSIEVRRLREGINLLKGKNENVTLPRLIAENPYLSEIQGTFSAFDSFHKKHSPTLGATRSAELSNALKNMFGDKFEKFAKNDTDTYEIEKTKNIFGEDNILVIRKNADGKPTGSFYLGGASNQKAGTRERAAMLPQQIIGQAYQEFINRGMSKDREEIVEYVEEKADGNEKAAAEIKQQIGQDLYLFNESLQNDYDFNISNSRAIAGRAVNLYYNATKSTPVTGRWFQEKLGMLNPDDPEDSKYYRDSFDFISDGHDNPIVIMAAIDDLGLIKRKELNEPTIKKLENKLERYKIEFSQMHPHQQISILNFMDQIPVFKIGDNKRLNEFLEIYNRTLNMGEDK
tara:strand:- start:11908 stop:13515 length:1608 start_codon:yes stop_codon:yes gene_type:complete